MPEKKLSILHLASDEKFINAANYIFEKAFPGCNRFIVPNSIFHKNLRFVEKKPNVEIVPVTKGLIPLLSKKTREYDCVVMHGISSLNSTVYLSAKDKNKFIGILWGAELFNEKFFPERSLKGELTASIKLPEPDNSIKDSLKKFIGKYITLQPALPVDATRSAVKSLPYFGLFDEEILDPFKEGKMISETYRTIPFMYYPLEFIIKGNEDSRASGNDILLGNSASFTNNHLEAFGILRHFDLSGRKIVVPLSYGLPAYADYIQAQGVEIFGNNFISLRKFMPLSEYNKIIKACGIVIMNHYRPQAVGNIVASLWMGSKVYLSDSNTFSNYLRKIGIIVYSIEKELNKENNQALTKLTEEEVEHNRSILKNTFNEEYVVKKLNEAIVKYF